MSDQKPHSADHFVQSRDHWWNPDFVSLIAKRFRIGNARRVLDVGCGVGHWSRVLAPVLHPDAMLTGVDPEPKWVEEATRRAVAAGFAERFHYQRATAEDLPFGDGEFDLVTCQTVLMHVADPEVALPELWRVLQPGGLLFVVEPNNRAAMLILDSIDEDRDIDDIVADVRGELIRQRGKRRSGEGDDSLGDRLPAMVSKLGPSTMQIYLADKTWTTLPPYDDPLTTSYLGELRDQNARGMHGWPRQTALRWFIAGGGTEHEFEPWWQRQLRRDGRILEAVDEGTYSAPGAGINYLIGARKPA